MTQAFTDWADDSSEGLMQRSIGSGFLISEPKKKITSDVGSHTVKLDFVFDTPAVELWHLKECAF